MTPSQIKELVALFALEGPPRSGEVKVHCPNPDHEDQNPSCSANFAKNVYHCYACKASGKLTDLLTHETEETVATSSAEGFPPDPPDSPMLNKQHREFLDNRKLDLNTTRVGFASSGDGDDSTLRIIPVAGAGQERRDNGEPRYKTYGHGLFWATEPPPPGHMAWLVEGPLDAVALQQAGACAAAAALGSSLSDDKAYELREYFTLIAMDRDGPGYKGAQKASEKLTEFHAPHVIVELPTGGKDPGELQQHRPDFLRSWVQQVELEYTPDEQRYVEAWRTLPTWTPVPLGYPEVDAALGGGLLPGLHVLVGPPGAGKSGVVLSQARAAARRGQDVVYFTTELPKREVWARLSAGIPGAPEWRTLERDPTMLPATCRPAQAELARHIHIVENVPLGRALQIVDQVDPSLLIVDYLQEVRGFGGDDKERTQKISGQLREYARVHELPILAVSSTSRSHYEGASLGAAKNSGDVEYQASTVSTLEKVGYGDRAQLHWKILKSRRGGEGVASRVPIDLARNVNVEEEG